LEQLAGLFRRYSTGEHLGDPVHDNATKRGLPQIFLAEIDELLLANKGQPRFVQNQMILKYWNGNADEKVALDLYDKIRARAKTLKSHKYRRIAVDAVVSKADLDAYLANKMMPETLEEIMALPPVTLFVLWYEWSPEFGPAVAVSSREVLLNAWHEIQANPNSFGYKILTVKADATHNREIGGYKHTDFGVDVLRHKQPHLWRDVKDDDHKPTCTFHKYLYVSCKSESTFSYRVGFKGLRLALKVLWNYTDVKIMVVGGDPQRALFAAGRWDAVEHGDASLLTETNDVEHVPR